MKLDLSTVTGPCPELALAVARMMVKRKGWKEVETKPAQCTFSRPGMDEIIVPLGDDERDLVLPLLFRPDLDRNQLWGVEEALKTVAQRNEYLDLIRSYLMDDELATGDVWWDFRHAPAWLCCVAALEAVGDAAGGEG